MFISRLQLETFRNHVSTEVEFGPGVCALVGNNGAGKSNIIESIGIVSQLKSFRGAQLNDTVMYGAPHCVSRANIVRADNEHVVDVLISSASALQVNRDRVRLTRPREVVGLLPTVTFCPEDLTIVKGAPSFRREFLDDVMVNCDPARDRDLAQLARIVKQRNMLLKEIAGKYHGRAALPLEVQTSLDVWNERYVVCATEVAHYRSEVAQALHTAIAACYATVSGFGESAGLAYDPDWLHRGLAQSLNDVRADEFRRGTTLVGPQRDDVELTIDGAFARTHASQGQQRSLALALRLSSHELIAEQIGVAPVLLLDDVFSELDPSRSAALISALPKCQTILTSAIEPPESLAIERIYDVDHGQVIRRR